MNRVCFVGKVISDVIYKPGKDGTKSMLRFTISSQDGKNKAGDYMNTNAVVVMWDKTADFTAEKNIKGKFVSIDGQLKNNNWTDSSGVKHYDLQIVANGKVEVFDAPQKKEHKTEEGFTESFYDNTKTTDDTGF